MIFSSSGQSNAKMMASLAGVWILMAWKYLAAGSWGGQQLVSNKGAPNGKGVITLGHLTSRNKNYVSLRAASFSSLNM